MKLTTRIIAVAIALFLGLTGSAAPADCAKHVKIDEAESNAIVAAALPAFDDLLKMAVNAKTAYGFDADDDLHEVVMGAAFPVYTVSNAAACDYCAGEKVESVLTESGKWLIPLTINGTARTFIEVTKLPGSNEFVAQRGSAILAKVWNTILDRWPPKKDFHPKLVAYPGIPGYFFTIPEVEPQNMTDTVRILAEVDHPTALSPASVIIHSWN